MRQILHIDMNSYFATVEQQANPKLRGKPIAVLGSTAKRSIIVAASVEAKRFGVKTATKLEDARVLCPQLILVHGEPRKYSWVTKKFIEIFEDYTDKVEIFSIDECFLDVTKTARLFTNTKSNVIARSRATRQSSLCHSEIGPGNLGLDPRPNERIHPFGQASCAQDDKGIVNLGEWSGAVNIALEIKQRIRDEIGGFITCSVGVSKNKFLAKTGSDLKKPDGLVVITPNSLLSSLVANPGISGGPSEGDPRVRKDDIMMEIATSQTPRNDVGYFTVDEVLLNLPLSEFCGIGRRISQRLGALGIENTEQLRSYPNTLLNKEFGIASGEKLKRMAYGMDSSPVISWHDRTDAKSYGHSRTLNKNVTDREEIKKHILLLSEKVAARMRKDGCMGREIGLWIRFGDFTGTGQRHRGSKWVHDGVEISDAAVRILKMLVLRAPVRAIGVYVTGIQRVSNTTTSLLPEDTINDKILAAMDAVNNRFGETVVTRARLAGTKIKEVVSGMGRDKF